jgi:hypothetical protein
MSWRMISQYKWVALPVFTLALFLSWFAFTAQGQLLPSGGLLSGFIILKSVPAFRLIDALSNPLTAPIKIFQVGGGLLVPSIYVRRLWLLAGRVWFFERWFWAYAGRWRIFGRLSWVALYTQSLGRRLAARF